MVRHIADEVLSMGLEWISPKQAAEKWGISERRVQALCASGKIKGVTRFTERTWLIPRDSLKPEDGRRTNGRKCNSKVKREKTTR